ncbi:MAG: lysophospholipid acyltransferase family protein [Eubacteriales bacterium]|nr:lysophospholipid acyltransferase family protein [Eubacteriales bacterium]
MNLRSFRTLFYVIYFLIVTTPKRSDLRELAKTDPEESARISHQYVKRALRHLLRIAGVKVEVSGLENIPEEPCLYVGNHSSYYDIIVAESVIPGGTGFVAKDSLKKIPLLASWMNLIHCLFLDRDNAREGLKTILLGADYLKEGFSMFIFPEGTRSRDGQIAPFKGGSMKMAQKADAPVVPVAISGSAEIFEKNEGLRVTPGTVKISFGSPFRISELSREDKKRAGELARNSIQNMLVRPTASLASGFAGDGSVENVSTS